MLKDAPIRELGKPAVAQDNLELAKVTTVCPDCGMTAIEQFRSCNYVCLKCHKAFIKKEQVTNG